MDYGRYKSDTEYNGFPSRRISYWTGLRGLNAQLAAPGLRALRDGAEEELRRYAAAQAARGGELHLAP